MAIVDDRSGVAAALADALRAEGVAAAVVADRPEGPVSTLLDLSGLRPRAGPELARRALLRAQAVEAGVVAAGGAYVVVADGGAFGLRASPPGAPWRAALGGLAKCLAHEWPTVAVRSLDIDADGRPPSDVAADLLAELRTGGAETEVALTADGDRYVLRSVPAPAVSTAAPPLEGLVVVSGGARGVTARCVRALAARCSCAFLLLGRSPLIDEPKDLAAHTDERSLRAALLRQAGPGAKPVEAARRAAAILAAREARATMAELESLGAPARYAAVDIRERVEVARAVDEARARFGPVRGVIHGAGVLADKVLADKTPAQFDAVFGTKAVGLDVLLDVTAEDPLRLLALFSSVVGRAGNRGQTDYGMANEVLNKRAWAEQRRRGDACRVVSINWGPWDGGMVSAGLKQHFDALGIRLLPADMGADLFVSEILMGGDGAAEVVYGDGFTLP